MFGNGSELPNPENRPRHYREQTIWGHGGSKSLSDWPNWPYPHKDQHHIHEFVQPVLQRCRLWQKNRLPWVKQRRCPRQFGVFCYSTSHLNVDVERQNGKMYSWGVAQSDWDILWLTFDPKISIACLRSKYRIDRMYHEMWTVPCIKCVNSMYILCTQIVSHSHPYWHDIMYLYAICR
jgi:hypothetical protein